MVSARATFWSAVKWVGEAASEVRFTDAYSRIKRWHYGSEVVILLYHRVSPNSLPWLLDDPVSPQAFEAQLQYLSSHYEIMSLDEVAKTVFNEHYLGRRIASVTFDDGRKDNFSYAFPLLKKYHIPSTIFLITDPIESRSLLWWDKLAYAIMHTTNNGLHLGGLGDYTLGDALNRKATALKIINGLKLIPDHQKSKLIEKLMITSGVHIPPEAVEEAILTWEDVRSMNKEGVSFGAHSVFHPILTNIPIEKAKYEICESKSQIEKQIGQKVDYFAYPNGESDSALAKIVEESGFSGAVGVGQTWITHTTDRFRLGRVGIYWDTLNTFRLMLSGIAGDWEALSHKQFADASKQKYQNKFEMAANMEIATDKGCDDFAHWLDRNDSPVEEVLLQLEQLGLIESRTRDTGERVYAVTQRGRQFLSKSEYLRKHPETKARKMLEAFLEASADS